MMPQKAERALIRKVLTGDRQAAGNLVRAYQGALYAYMLRLSGKPEVAEDVTQEAFVRALTNLERYDERFRFSTWLFTIAKRLWVNANQRLAPSYDSEVIGAIAGPASWVDAAERRELSGATGDALHKALAVLSDEQREALVLFYQLNWSVEQIAQHLDLPDGTVKSHLFRARARLRDALEAQQNIPASIREVLA